MAETKQKNRRQVIEDARRAALDGEWDLAIEINKELIARDPKDSAAYNRLGRAYLEKRDYSAAYDAYSDALKSDPAIQMAYGRLDVSLDRFFQQGMLVTYRPSEDQKNLPPASSSGIVSELSRVVFRNQLESDLGKKVRWWTEIELGPELVGESTRNSLLNEPVVTLADNDPTRTDILHEYFVAPDRFPEFIEACQEVIPASYQQLLNVTVRYVDTDKDSVLAYATEPRIASVMLFSQEKTERGEPLRVDSAFKQFAITSQAVW